MPLWFLGIYSSVFSTRCLSLGRNVTFCSISFLSVARPCSSNPPVVLVRANSFAWNLATTPPRLLRLRRRSSPSLILILELPQIPLEIFSGRFFHCELFKEASSGVPSRAILAFYVLFFSYLFVRCVGESHGRYPARLYYGCIPPGVGSRLPI